ncbi:MAG TPA: dihydrofolate reductase family protein [Candidatus Saccharimonadia bacterium]|nr:dihydrofolate reductase family protein [Candidatus Saccharimonadia bacterium]
MRKLVVSEFMSLDGVMEDPGGDGSSSFGGWTRPYGGERFMKFKFDELMASEALLLGRITYEGFAKAWPNITGTGEFGERMNSIKKFVATTTLTSPEWQNSERIAGDVAESARKLKQLPGKDILVAGSANLLQTLIKHKLVDEYRVMLYPVVLGEGKKLFKDSVTANLELVECEDFGTGVVLLTYRPSGR